MTINGVEIKEIIKRAQLLLEQEKNISSTFKSVLNLLFLLLHTLFKNFANNGNSELEALKAENANLKEELQAKQQKLFGKKSEINIGEIINSDLETHEEIQSTTVSAYTRKKKTKLRGRKIDTSLLPRFKMYHDLNHNQKTCICCNNELEKMGQDTSEQLEVLPMLLYVTEHIRYKYKCRKCQTLLMAQKPPAPLPKSLAGGSLLAEVVVNKFQYHLPLYRQSKIFASYKANIPDNTIGNWVQQSGEQLMSFLAEPMWQAIIAAKYLQVDETPIKVQSTNSKGYLWSYFAPYVGNGLVMFEFSITRSNAVPETRLAIFKGGLQTDGYAGYNNLRKRQYITGFGCLTHSRRKFDEVVKITNNKSGVAAAFIERIKPLYALEAKMDELNYNFHTKKRLRQRQAWPIFKALHSWLKQQLIKTPPKSKLGKAIIYTLNQWQYITAYLRHGMAKIDTNWVENEIRPTAVGKKNWLFMNNEDSGSVNAFWFSLVQSALINSINPRIYIHFLLMNIHDLRKKSIEPSTFLAHVIDKKLLQEFEVSQLALSKKILNSS